MEQKYYDDGKTDVSLHITRHIDPDQWRGQEFVNFTISADTQNKTPCQLPSLTSNYIERPDQFKQMCECTQLHEQGQTYIQLGAKVSGTGGVGKTQLAILRLTL